MNPPNPSSANSSENSKWAAANYLQKKFRKYYQKYVLQNISHISEREFGIGMFGKKIAQRHWAFSSLSEFNSFLVQQAPLYVSYSNAYYSFPAKQPMSAKQLRASEITYEFDADDIPTSCKSSHDQWACATCSAFGTGNPDNCSSCGSAVKIENWYCPECLNAARDYTLKLLEVVRNDFNITDGLSINFSGNAGYHVHLTSPSVLSLSPEARIQLLNYLTLHELDVRLHGFLGVENKTLYAPIPSSADSISQRLLLTLHQLIQTKAADELAAYGFIPSKKAEQFLELREQVLDKMNQGILLGLPAASVKSSEKFWTNLLQYAVQENTLPLDRQSSVDMHKIMRVPNTLHGSTGLLAKTLPISTLDRFSPLTDCVVFNSAPVKVFIKNAPPFYLAGQSFGPFREEFQTLPEFAAIYLAGKGKAQL